MSEKKTLILVDGHALAFRQYYALERTGMKNSENLPTWAVYGFFKAIFDLLDKIKPDFTKHLLQPDCRFHQHLPGFPGH